MPVALVAMLAVAVGAGAADAPRQPVTNYNVTDMLKSPYDTQAAFGAGLHSDSRNSDYEPITQAGPVNLKWQSQNGTGLIPGSTTPFAQTPNSDSTHSWVTSGRGVGYSSLIELDVHTGQVVWQSAPYDGTSNTITDYAVFVAPNVDRDGNVYVIDGKAIYSFTDSGRLRWRTSLEGTGVTKPWVGTALFTNEGLFGSATMDGWWLFVDPSNGKIKIKQQFPATAVQPCSPLLQASGQLFGRYLGNFSQAVGRDLACLAFGKGLVITETTGYNPVLSEIIQNNSNADASKGRVSAWKVATNRDGSMRLDEVWETLLAPGSATSPTMSLQSNLVFAADGNGTMNALDATDGHVRWQSPPGLEAAFSPQTDQFGNLVAGAKTVLNKFSGQDGSLLWQQNYDFLIPQTGLTTGPPNPFILDREPHSFVAGLTVVGPNTMSVLVAFGYKAKASVLPSSEAFLPIEQVTAIILVDATTGAYIPNSLRIQPQGRGPNGTGSSTDTGAPAQSNGFDITGQAEVYSTFVYALLNPVLNGPYKLPPITAGWFGSESEDHLALATRAVHDTQGWNAEALTNVCPSTDATPEASNAGQSGNNGNGDHGTVCGSNPNDQRAFDLVRRGVVNLNATAVQNVEAARAAGQLTAKQSDKATKSIRKAADSLDKARDMLLEGTGSRSAVVQQITKANESLSDALAVMAQGTPARPPAPYVSSSGVAQPDTFTLPSLTLPDNSGDVAAALAQLEQQLIAPLVPLRSERALLALARFAPWHGDQYAMGGLQTTSVVPLSFYARLGLRAGDVILTVNGDRMTSGAQTQKALTTFETSVRLTVEILRNGRPMTLRGLFPV